MRRTLEKPQDSSCNVLWDLGKVGLNWELYWELSWPLWKLIWELVIELKVGKEFPKDISWMGVVSNSYES